MSWKVWKEEEQGRGRRWSRIRIREQEAKFRRNQEARRQKTRRQKTRRQKARRQKTRREQE